MASTVYLTVARSHARKLLDNAQVVRWLSQHRQVYLSEYRSVAELESPMLATTAAE